MNKVVTRNMLKLQRPGFTDDVTGEGERLRGITDLLQRSFWSNYRYGRATKSAVRVSSNTNAARGKFAGMARGTVVDGEICGFVNRGVEPQHPYARKVVKALALAGLHPVRAQVSVTSPAHGLGTGVDLLCTRKATKEKRYVIVELKAGFNRPGVYDMTDGAMQRCLRDLPNSPRMQHAIQTVVTRALFMTTYPECGEVDACVLRVTDDGVHIHPVDASLYGRASSILEVLSQARHRMKRAVKAPKRKPGVRIVKSGRRVK